MTSHFGLMLVFALFVSVIFATITKDTPRDQLTLGARMFATFIGAAIVLGWPLRLFPVIGLWLPVAIYMAAIYYGATMPWYRRRSGLVSRHVQHAGGYRCWRC